MLVVGSVGRARLRSDRWFLLPRITVGRAGRSRSRPAKRTTLWLPVAAQKRPTDRCGNNGANGSTEDARGDVDNQVDSGCFGVRSQLPWRKDSLVARVAPPERVEPEIPGTPF